MAQSDTVSGSDGRVFVASGATGTPELLVTRYVMTKGGTLGEITNSTSGKAEKHKPVKTGGSIELDVLFDATKTFEAASCDFGDEITLDLRIGSSTLAYNGVPAIVESMALTGCTQDAMVSARVMTRINGVVPDPSAWTHT